MSRDRYRDILRSTSIIGGASVINILIGLVRVKIAALLLAPAGMGLVGLLNNLVATASSISALGLGTVGTRQIAEAVGSGDGRRVTTVRRVLFWGTLALAMLGGLAFWLLRQPLAEHVIDHPTLSTTVGWLAIAVVMTVVAGSQSALLNGLRRIGDLARLSVLSAALGTILACGSLLIWGEQGLLAFLLLPPLCSAAVGCYLTLRLPRPDREPMVVAEFVRQWALMVRLGSAFMLAGLAMTAGQLAVRAMVQRELGFHALGLFECAWLLSMTYINFVLNAMGTDYYPRLSASIGDPESTNRLVNEQTEVALLLAAPIFMVMLAATPLIIQLLYSRSFVDAASILRWQILGDILKVASWPLGFVMLAAGRGRAFMLCETIVVSVFVISSWVLVPWLGVQGAGLGFLLMYVALLPIVYLWVRRRTGFAWTAEVIRQWLLLMGAAVLLALVGAFHAASALVLGTLCTAAFAIRGVRRLGQLAESPHPGAVASRLWSKIAAAAQRLKAWAPRKGE